MGDDADVAAGISAALSRLVGRHRRYWVELRGYSGVPLDRTTHDHPANACPPHGYCLGRRERTSSERNLFRIPYYPCTPTQYRRYWIAAATGSPPLMGFRARIVRNAEKIYLTGRSLSSTETRAVRRACVCLAITSRSDPKV